MSGQARALARSSLAAAAGVTALYLGSLLPAARISVLCLAAIGVAFVRMSCSARWAFGCFAVTGLLSLLLLPEKTLALLYVLLPGYYPILKLRAERYGSVWVRWAIKLAVFHAAAAAAVGLAQIFAPLGSLVSGVSVLIIWIGALAVFLVYDYVLGLLILYYLRSIAGRIR